MVTEFYYNFKLFSTIKDEKNKDYLFRIKILRAGVLRGVEVQGGTCTHTGSRIPRLVFETYGLQLPLSKGKPTIHSRRGPPDDPDPAGPSRSRPGSRRGGGGEGRGRKTLKGENTVQPRRGRP